LDCQLIAAFRQIPYGIYVLAAEGGSGLHPIIVSWVSQVSYSPPLLMIALRRNRKIIPALQESRHFSLSLLKADQKGLVHKFKDPVLQPNSSELFEKAGPKGSPLLKGCLACWECQLFSITEAGDHILFLGEAQSAWVAPEGAPLTTADLGKTYIGQY